MANVHSGGCRCGAVRFSVSAAPNFSVYCHCDDCRRATGAPVVAFVGFCSQDVNWQTGKGENYANGAAQRLFCAKCGAPFGYRDTRMPERIFFYTAAMDAPERYPPKAHSYAGEQLPWLHLADRLPRHRETLVIRPNPGKAK